MALQIRRGPNAQRATTLLQTGEVVWTTDTKKLYVGDGVTTGGVNILANIAGTGFVWNPSTEQLDLAGSTITGINADNVAETNGIVPRLWYRSSLGKTHASEIFTTVAGAGHTGISFSWDDVNQKLSATVLTENAADAAAALFTSGTHTGISFAYGLTQDAANRIDATVSSEYIQDTVNDLITAGVHTGITFTYSDSLNSLSAAVNMGGNLASNLVLNTFNISGTGNISNTGNIFNIGNITTNSLTTSNTVIGTNTSPTGLFTNFTGVSNGTDSTTHLTRISRGTLSSKTSVQPGDSINIINGEGYDGTNFINVGGFGLFVDPAGTVSTGNVPGIFGVLFVVSATLVAMTFNRAGVLSAPIVQTGSYTTTQRNALTPAVGMMIYNTTINKFQGYQNTGGTTLQWVDLS